MKLSCFYTTALALICLGATAHPLHAQEEMDYSDEPPPYFEGELAPPPAPAWDEMGGAPPPSDPFPEHGYMSDVPPSDAPLPVANPFVEPEQEVQVLRGSNPNLGAAPSADIPSWDDLNRKRPEKTANTASSSGTSSVKVRKKRASAYQQSRPKWAFELMGSVSALGGSPTLPELNDGKVQAISAQMDYQPLWSQDFGVLGFGGSFNYYRTPTRDVGEGVLGLWSVGAQARYQLRLMQGQILVPVLGYGTEYWSYSLIGGQKGRLVAHGPMAGAMLLLNFFEPRAAREAFAERGLSRSYLVAELRGLSGSDEVVDFAGRSLFFGLRFEY